MHNARAVRAPDAGDMVVGWLVRLVAVFSVLGVLVFDGVSLGASALSVTDTASAAAREAQLRLTDGATAQQAYEAAYDVAVVADGRNELPVEQFVVSPDGSVSLLVRRTSPTLVLHHVPRVDEWLVAEATATRAAR